MLKKILTFAIILISLHGFARGDDFRGRGIVSYQRSEQDGGAANQLSQRYELRYQRAVAESVQYRLFMAWQDDRGSVTLREPESQRIVKQKSEGSQIEPALDVMVNFSPVTVQAGGNFRLVNSKSGNAPEHEGRFLKLYGNFNLFPEKFPSLAANVTRRTSEDQATNIETADDSLSANIGYTYKGLSLQSGGRYSRFEDNSTGFSRDIVGYQGGLNYAGGFLDDRLTLQAGYYIGLNELTEKTGNKGGGSAPLQIAPVQGLYANDPTPLNSLDNPLVNTPSLIDGNLAASSGIDIGSGGQSLQNIGVDLGTALPADRVRIHVRTAAGNLVSAGGSITWSIYAGSDGINWELVTANAAASFIQSLGYFEITFARTAARFLKVVNFGVNTAESLVTEMEVFRQTPSASAEPKKSTFLNQNGTLNMTARPFSKVALTYSGTFNAASQDSLSQSFSSTEMNNLAAADFGPFGFATAGLRYQGRRSSQTSGLDQSSDNYTGRLNWSILPTLDTAFSITHGEERVGGAPTLETNSTALTADMRLYPTWRVTLSLGYAGQKDLQNSRSSDSLVLAGTSSAQLTRSLDWSMNFSAQWGSSFVSSATAQVFQKSQAKSIYSDFNYRPSPQLNLGAHLGYLATDSQSGFVQGYRINWIPFPDGTVLITTRYDLDRDPISGQNSYRFSVAPRWNINPNLYLDLNYSHVVRKALVTTTVNSYFATLNFTI